jgi:cbb3-type cytochrome oxidase maturation protein
MAPGNHKELEAVPPPRSEVRRGGGRWFLWIFGPTVILVAGTAFIFKLTEFILVATTDGPDALGSFLIPVVNYLLVAAGFLCMFLWAYFSGQFRDVEAPKYRMLEMQREIDQQEAERG